MLVCAAAADPAAAQAPAPAPIAIGDVVVSGSVRTRVEAWDWFDGDANGDYAFSGSLFRIGAREARTHVTWQVEAAVPLLLGLPDDAVAAGAQGQLGLGASYFAANGTRTNVAAFFLKQALVRFTGVGVSGQSFGIGRAEFIDGTETVPKNATLAALKRDRIAHRLLGNFTFSHVGRSFDGVQYALERPAWNVTALAGRPTEGVFQVDGWGELDVNVAYGAVTHAGGGASHASEWRAFVVGYDDRRSGVVKTDNRPAAARRDDTNNIALGTVGGHYLDAITTPAGIVDVLAWGALQTGSWGTLDHRAGSLALELGWQPSRFDRLRPWIRGGYDYGSGDDDPNDGAHHTFFQLLPTPRVYARLPFFNLMNSADAFGELLLRPSTRATIRADVHALRLAEPNDLWYSGGGAFQPGTFGYTGRPSNGASALATLVDGSLDYTAGPHAVVTGYVGFAHGGAVVERIYPAGRDARLGYVELTLRF